MATGGRPLSPHLGVYRWQITMALSILQRITGVGLGVGAIVLTYWLAAAAYGPEAFVRAQAVVGHPVGLLFLFGWTFALVYHLCNGIRHLFWDMGKGFEISEVNFSGWIVVLVSLIVTVLIWFIGFGMAGG